MSKTLKELAEKEEQLPDDHPDWQHVAFGWRSLAIAQDEKIQALKEDLKRMTEAKNGFQSAFVRAANENDRLRSKPCK